LARKKGDITEIGENHKTPKFIFRHPCMMVNVPHKKLVDKHHSGDMWYKKNLTGI
jgi:hypothetical protein